MNLINTKNKFYHLLESKLGDVKPLINEQPVNPKTPPSPVPKGVNPFATSNSIYKTPNKPVEYNPVHKSLGEKNFSPVGKGSNVVEKVRLIFPLYEKEEIGLNLLKNFNIFTGYFKSLGDALQIINGMIKDGVKTKELVIGSHGGGEQLLITKSGENFKFDNSFLEKIKQVITPATKVFFTACYGADSLEMLKDAAEKLGVGAYGSAGRYNYITNESETGFYWCSPTKYQMPTDEELHQPLSIDGDSLIIKYLSDEPSQINFTLTTNIFGAPINLTNKFEYSSERLGGDINAKYLIEGTTGGLDYIMREYIENLSNADPKNPNGNILFNSYRKQMSKTPDMNKFVIEEFQKGNIIIKVNGIDVKTLKPFKIPKSPDNEFLLENNLCKKVSEPPISWVDQNLHKLAGKAWNAVSKGYQNLTNFFTD